MKYYTIVRSVSLLMGASLKGPRKTLNDEYKEIQALIPDDKLYAITEYYLDDEEVRKIDDYLQSKDAIDALRAVLLIPEVQDLITWISENADMEDASRIAKRDEKLNCATNTFSGVTGGWDAYVNDILEVLPFEEMRLLAKSKAEKGGIFAEFYYKVKDMGKVFQKANNIPEVEKFVANLEKLGVNLDKIYDLLRKFFA